MKTISLLGSTGSIGTQTLEIVRDHDDLNVVALTANSNVELMEKQIREFRPALAVMYDDSAAKDLKARVSDLQAATLSFWKNRYESLSHE